MCGIVGYIGTNQAAPVLLDALSKIPTSMRPKALRSYTTASSKIT